MMDLNNLNSSGKNIRLSESTKNRIITECSKYAKNSDSEYTDHVMLEGGGFKTNDPDLYNKVKKILRN